jgi:hypothetical protein
MPPARRVFPRDGARQACPLPLTFCGAVGLLVHVAASAPDPCGKFTVLPSLPHVFQ